MLELALRILVETWHILLDASIFVLFGLLVAGLIRVFLSPGSIGRHLGKGRIVPVIKAAMLGIPLPL